jgi:FkbM family methyltransferase
MVGYAILGRELAAIAPDRRAAARLLFAASARPLFDRLPMLRGRPLRLRLRYRDHAFSYSVGNRSELDVLAGAFLTQEYRVELDAPVRTILDLGANAGATLHYFRAEHPQAALYAYEPDPDTFRRLTCNVRGMPQVVLREEAVGGEDCERGFKQHPLSWASAFVTDGGAEATTRVTARSLDSIVAELGLDSIDVLKIDIEGAEAEALERFDGLGRVRAVVGEWHEGMHGRPFADLAPRFDGFELELRPDAERVHHFAAVRREPSK